MLRIALDGQEELAGRLADMPDVLRAALAEKAEALAQNLLTQVVDANLSGGVLNARSGALRASIQMEVSPKDSGIDADIFSDGDIPYAAIQEFGGKTAAHEILPDKSRVLAFVMNGKNVFARRVRHPGSQLPERSYLRSALEDQGEEIVGALTQAVAGAAGNLGESA